MDNQCANIFSTHATIYESHSVKFAFIERENIFFFMCILNLVFFFLNLVGLRSLNVTRIICELQKIFFLRDMMDNQCANIFSTHATVYGSHSAMFAFY